MNAGLRIGRLVAAAALVLAIAGIGQSAGAAGIATGQPRADRATQMLFDAVHTNDFAAAEAAVAAGANVEARDRWDSSPIELAIDKGYFRIAHFLVSVRNSRMPANEVAGQARPQAEPVAAPVRQQAAAAPAKRVAAVPAAQVAQPQEVVDQPQWPADKPNPFDPSAPAFGTALPIIPAAPAATAEGASGEGPMLATEEAARRAGEVLR